MADQQNEGFVRQRRNLMIVSLVLLFSEATDLRVEKISAFGTELLVGQPQAVTIALWIAAIYWLIRYYQYSRAGYHGALRNSVENYIHRHDICVPIAIKRLQREEPSLRDPINDEKTPPRIDYSGFCIMDIRHNSLRISFTLTKRAADGVTIENVGERIVRLNDSDLFWPRARAWIHTILHTTLFTELVLPYIVFALPVLYMGYKFIR